MVHASRPLDGEPMRLLKQLAKGEKIIVGGSYLAESNGHVYNTFVLAFPDGRTFTHDKDFPTGDVEQQLYAPGEDSEFLKLLRNPIRGSVIQGRKGNSKSGVFDTGDLRIGNALCWELVRKRTDERLLEGEVDLILAASGWWHFSSPQEAQKIYGATASYWREKRKIDHASLIAAPKRLASMVGAPVVHANLVGNNQSFAFPLGDQNLGRDFLGESQIVDSDGREIARRPEAEGEGVVIGSIKPGHRQPTKEIGEGFWHIDEAGLDWWYDGYGRDYYLAVTKPQRTLLRQSQDRTKD